MKINNKAGRFNAAATHFAFFSEISSYSNALAQYRNKINKHAWLLDQVDDLVDDKSKNVRAKRNVEGMRR